MELLSRTMQDSYMDVGGRAKQEARAEQLSRAKHDSREGGGRAKQEARAEEVRAEEAKAEEASRLKH